MRAEKGEVTALYAWITEGEGIVAVNLAGMGWSPAVSYDARIIAMLKPKVAEVARATNKTIHLVRATNAEVIDTVGGTT